MSPRTDSYLSVCLQEASKSPLHYRHGCIVVSGGKIIGKGFNDYRPGFNGGALKTGKLAASSALNGSAVAAIKQKQKSKSKLHLHLESTTVGNEQMPKSNATFTPFETAAIGSSGGGGHLANTPLSMHSEMMAIHSALALSSTLESQGSARSSRWLEKPCFKLPGRGKRELRLRGLKAYVEAVCGGQCSAVRGDTYSGESSVQASRFEAATRQCGEGQGLRVQRQQQERGGEGGAEKETECAGASRKECRESLYSESVWVSSRGEVSGSCPPPRGQVWTTKTTTLCA